MRASSGPDRASASASTAARTRLAPPGNSSAATTVAAMKESEGTLANEATNEQKQPPIDVRALEARVVAGVGLRPGSRLNRQQVGTLKLAISIFARRLRERMAPSADSLGATPSE